VEAGLARYEPFVTNDRSRLLRFMKPTSSGPPSAALERKRRLERERYAKDPEYRERRREQKREYKRTRYANDPGFRERQLLVIGERNRERLATDAEYRERNREYRRRKKGRAVARQLTARRRADLMEGSA